VQTQDSSEIYHTFEKIQNHRPMTNNPNLMGLLQGALNDNMIDQLSKQLGGADKKQTAAAASGIVATLVGALAQNASTAEGAQSLNKALERDHDGSVLNDLMGALTGKSQAVNPRAVNGTGILDHVLGNRQSGAVQMISKLSGLDASKTNNLMAMLAPVVLGSLGKAKREQGLDVAGIVSMLSGTVSSQQQGNPTMNLIMSFLGNKKGGGQQSGNLMGDVAKVGMNLLGGFLKGKR
jgi:hypothetical protein